MKCPFCGLDPYEYINETCRVPNCCEPGMLLFGEGLQIDEIVARISEERYAAVAYELKEIIEQYHAPVQERVRNEDDEPVPF